MAKKSPKTDLQNLPACAAEFIRLVIKKMRYRRKVRSDVMAELAAHFEDELKDCTKDEEREQKAQQLIKDFGDAKLLAVLLRRAKKRCRALWRTVVARTFQTVGILLFCFILYTVWFMTGRPTISVDYLALLNEMNQPQLADEDNAWPHYEKAIELLVEPNETLRENSAFKNYEELTYENFANLNQAEQKEIREWVEQNKAAWQEVVAGSLKSYCYRKYEVGASNKDKWLFDVLMPHLKPFRYLTKAGVWRARIRSGQGQTWQGVQDYLAIVRLGRHLQRNIVIIEQLVGLAITRRGCYEILNIEAREKLSVTNLNDLQQQLLELYTHGFPRVDIEGERLMFLDMVQQLFTDGGPGGGHLIPKRYEHLMNSLDDSWELEMGEAVEAAALSMVHAGRNKTMAEGSRIYDKLSEIVQLSPYERHTRKATSIEDRLRALPQHRYFLLYTLVPAIDRISELRFQTKALYEATLTVLALQRWQLAHGEYPASLDELIAAHYLKQLPDDPYSGKPLVYSKTEENFTLYSLGRDFIDDGGEYGKDKRGKLNIWGDEGDAVFWPVFKPEIKQEQ